MGMWSLEAACARGCVGGTVDVDVGVVGEVMKQFCYFGDLLD